MGNIRNAQQKYDEAIEYHERAFKNIQTNLGEKHYFTGDCFYSLAVDFIRSGDHERAM
jgi:tetratricopeptide (TPR) repeat protein